MRILLKIALFPVLAILVVGSIILRFFTIISGTIMNILSFLMASLLTILLIAGSVELSANYPVYIVCFLFSEFGLFALANLILDGVDNITAKLISI